MENMDSENAHNSIVTRKNNHKYLPSFIKTDMNKQWLSERKSLLFHQQHDVNFFKRRQRFGTLQLQSSNQFSGMNNWAAVMKPRILVGSQHLCFKNTHTFTYKYRHVDT